MIEKHLFTGGMDMDTEDRFLSNEDWRYAFNIQAAVNNEGSFGTIEKILGNKKITNSFRKTNHVCIGHATDLKNKRVFFFMCDTSTPTNPNSDGSFGQHMILNYNLTSNTVTLLYKSIWLFFNENYLITGADVIDGKFLYWTDDNQEPSKINIDLALSNEYPTSMDDRSYIDAMPYAPLYAPICSYNSVNNQGFNNLKNKLYQFKYRYHYRDSTVSSWSPVSKVCLPYNLSYSLENINWNNRIDLTIPITGNQLVDRIDVAVRDSNLSDFYRIMSLIGGVDYTITGSFAYPYWFNTETWDALDSAESNKVFDYVPIKAKSQAVIGTRLVYGNYVENYDFDEEIDAYIVAEYTNIRPNGWTGYLGGVTQAIENKSYYYKHYVFPYWNEDLYNAPYYVLTFDYSISGFEVYTFDYVLNTGATGSLSIPISNFSGNIDLLVDYLKDLALVNGIWAVNNDNYNGNGAYIQNIEGYWYEPYNGLTDNNIIFIANSQDSIPISERADHPYWLIDLTITVTTSYTGNVVGTPIPTWKRGANHKFGLVYYDQRGRASCVYTSNDLEILTEWWDQLNVYNGQIQFRVGIEHTPPIWAYKYQIVYGGNNTYLKDPEGRGFVQFKVGTVTSVGASHKEISLSPILGFNARYSNSVVNYTWTSGDRLRPIYDDSSAAYFTNTDNESYEIIKAETSGSDYLISIQNTNASYLIETGDIVELYSPATSGQNAFYYEIGEVFDILNPGTSSRLHYGNIQSQSSTQEALVELRGGDVYLTNRLMPSGPELSDPSSTFEVEESHYSDFQDSNDINIGRFNVVDPGYRQIRKIASVRYSDVYIPSTDVNGLGTFYDTNFNDFDQNYGSIQKLYSEDKRLNIFQEFKVGQSLINESVLNDLSGSQLVQRSDNVLSTIQYYVGEFGIGLNPESFSVYGFAKYFVDVYRGAVLRLSNDGITKISDYKMMSYFIDRFNTSFNGTDSIRVFGCYNERNREYILCMKEVTRTVENTVLELLPYETIIFNEAKNRWTGFVGFYPEWISPTALDYVTFNNGEMYLHNQSVNGYANFNGSQQNSDIKIIFNQNPSHNKFWKSIEIESNSIWIAPTITNQYGQSSELISDHFEKIENVYWSAFYKDINTGVVHPLYNGNDLRSPELSVLLRNSDSVYVKLFSVGGKFESSELTNR